MGLMLVRHTRPDVAPGVCYGRTDLDVAASFSAECETQQLTSRRDSHKLS